MHPVFARIRTYDGHYLCAENQGGGELNATRIMPREWETFGLMTAHGPTIHNGDLSYVTTVDERFFLQAQNGGGGAVDAAANQPGPSAVWRLQSSDGRDVLDDGATVHLLAADQAHYLCAENGGGGAVDATRPWAREWETFTLELLGAKPMTWDSGDVVVGAGEYLRASVTLQQDGTLIVDSTATCHKKLAGFTGGVVILLRDELGNLVGNSFGMDIGVDGQLVGQWTRTVHDEVRLSDAADLWERTVQIGAFMAVDPHRRLEQDVKEAALVGKTLADAFNSTKDIVDAIKQIFGVKSGTPPPK